MVRQRAQERLSSRTGTSHSFKLPVQVWPVWDCSYWSPKANSLQCKALLLTTSAMMNSAVGSQWMSRDKPLSESHWGPKLHISKIRLQGQDQSQGPVKSHHTQTGKAALIVDTARGYWHPWLPRWTVQTPLFSPCHLGQELSLKAAQHANIKKVAIYERPGSEKDWSMCRIHFISWDIPAVGLTLLPTLFFLAHYWSYRRIDTHRGGPTWRRIPHPVWR